MIWLPFQSTISSNTSLVLFWCYFDFQQRKSNGSCLYYKHKNKYYKKIFSDKFYEWKKKIPKIERMNRDWRVKRIVVNQCLMNGIEKTGRWLHTSSQQSSPSLLRAITVNEKKSSFLHRLYRYKIQQQRDCCRIRFEFTNRILYYFICILSKNRTKNILTFAIWFYRQFSIQSLNVELCRVPAL